MFKNIGKIFLFLLALRSFFSNLRAINHKP